MTTASRAVLGRRAAGSSFNCSSCGSCVVHITPCCCLPSGCLHYRPRSSHTPLHLVVCVQVVYGHLDDPEGQEIQRGVTYLNLRPGGCWAYGGMGGWEKANGCQSWQCSGGQAGMPGSSVLLCRCVFEAVHLATSTCHVASVWGYLNTMLPLAPPPTPPTPLCHACRPRGDAGCHRPDGCPAVHPVRPAPDSGALHHPLRSLDRGHHRTTG